MWKTYARDTEAPKAVTGWHTQQLLEVAKVWVVGIEQVGTRAFAHRMVQILLSMAGIQAPQATVLQ